MPAFLCELVILTGAEKQYISFQMSEEDTIKIEERIKIARLELDVLKEKQKEGKAL